MIALGFLLAYARHARHLFDSQGNYAIGIRSAFSELEALDLGSGPALSSDATWIAWRTGRPTVLYVPHPGFLSADQIVDRFGVAGEPCLFVYRRTKE